MSRTVQLSDSQFHVMRYVTPILMIFFVVIPYFNEDWIPLGRLMWMLGIGGGSWVYSLFFKGVKFDGNQLMVSDEFKSEVIHLDELESISIGGFPFNTVVVKTKSKSAFGNRFRFAAQHDSILPVRIYEPVRLVLSEIESYIESGKSKPEKESP